MPSSSSMTKSTSAPVIRRSPRGNKNKRVPTIGEELEGEFKKRSRTDKVSNKNKEVSNNKTKKGGEPLKKVRAPVRAEELAGRREPPPVGDKGVKEPPQGKRPNLRRTTAAPAGKKTSLPPAALEYVVPTKYDVLTTPSGKLYMDSEDEEEYSSHEDEDNEDEDDEDEDNEENNEYDGNNKDEDNMDEDYGNDEDHDIDDVEDEAIAEEGDERTSSDEELDRGQTNHRRTNASFSHRKFREHLEGMNHEEERAEEVVANSTAQHQGTVRNATARPSSSSRMQHLDALVVHVMTRKESLRNWQEHVAARVRAFVKNKLFRKVKFVNNDVMIQKAMKLVMDHEGVAESKRVNFHMLYESVFNEALNTKRSACEQAGGKIVIETMAMMNPDEEFFTIEELCKLRRSTTEREKKAFYWFFGSFLDCVCGKKAWGRTKFTNLVSLASETNSTAKIVTASDEAFALLLFDNYMDKWVKMANTTKEPEPEDEGDDQNKKKSAGTNRRRGKYTGAAAKSGHCKFGGWNREGMARFNELYALVREDRACPQANEMERKLLEFCNSKKPNVGSDGAVAAGQGGDEASRILANLEPPVEAVWEDMEEV